MQLTKRITASYYQIVRATFRMRNNVEGDNTMCDYSLGEEHQRDAIVGEKLTLRRFNDGCNGFVSRKDKQTAVCLLPGTRLRVKAPLKDGTTEEYSALFVQKTATPDDPYRDSIVREDQKTFISLQDLYPGTTVTVYAVAHETTSSRILQGITTPLDAPEVPVLDKAA